MANKRKKTKKKSEPEIELNQKNDYLNSAGVPEENVLDLKEMMKEREGFLESQEPQENKKARKQESKFKKYKDRLGEVNLSEYWQKIKPKKRIKTKPKKSFVIKHSKVTKIARPARENIYEKTKKKITVNKIFYSKLLKPVLAFGVVALIIIIPFYGMAFYQEANVIKGKVLGISTEAYTYLNSAKQEAQELEFDQADEQFQQAVESFVQAETELNKINIAVVMLAKVIPGGSQLSSAKNLLAAGKHVAKAGQHILQAAEPLLETDLTQVHRGSSSDINLTKTLAQSQGYLEPALQEIRQANKYMQKVKVEDVPPDKQAEIQQIQEILPEMESRFSEAMVLFDSLLEILGHNSPKRYLLLFQNNAEMRPTGGFVGSFALIDVNDGQVENIEIPGGGSYDVAGWQQSRVISPTPLHLINPHWNFQDANWWPDFPTSAEKTIWFYEKSGGPSVDGVIAVTPDTILELLEYTGPIDMTEDYDIIINHDNFLDFVQEESEKKYDETTTPKQFIADLAPVLLNKVLSTDQEELINLFSVLGEALQERQILIYFRDERIQEKVLSLDWAGAIKDSEGDYLAVINTNIGGGKTDIIIDQIINHQADIQDDGTIIDTVTITRLHKGVADDIYRGIKNVDYLRVYVPEGSELLEAKGFSAIDRSRIKDPEAGYELDEDFLRVSGKIIMDENTGTRINNEFGKTVFGNWVETSPGESSQVMFKYKLPFKLDLDSLWSKSDRYHCYIQKQSGDQGSYLENKVIYPPAWTVSWQYPDNLDTESGLIDINTVLDVDKYLGVVFKE